MELLMTILFALGLNIAPNMTIEQVKEKYKAETVEAQKIIDDGNYKEDPDTQVIIIDETGN